MSKNLFIGKTFLAKGLSDSDELFVKNKVEEEGGVFLSEFDASLDYLVYKPNPLVILPIIQAKELIEKGKPVKILSMQMFKDFLDDPEEFLTVLDHRNLFPFIIEEGELFRYYGVAENDVVYVPNGVTVIADEAFQGCRNIKKIVLPEGLIRINTQAFAGCSNLETINIPNGVTEIGGRAFSNCKSLKEIVLPEGLKTIQSGAFGGCESIKEITIPDGVVEIEGSTFAQCTSLKDVNLPDSLQVIGMYAFNECISLEKIEFGQKINEVQSWAFEACKSLKSVCLPPHLHRVDRGVFLNCESLETASIPYIREIREQAFSGCTHLKRIEISPLLRNIYITAFMNVPNEAFNYYEGGLYLGCEENPHLWFVKSYRPKKNEYIKAISIHEKTEQFAESSLAFTCGIKEVKIPKNISEISYTTIGAQTITIYETFNFTADLIPKESDFSFDVVIKSTEDDKIKYVIPMHCDGTATTDEYLRSCWEMDETTILLRIDNYFSNIRKVDAKIKTALIRIKYPYALGEKAKSDYYAFISGKSKQIIDQCIRTNDLTLLQLLGDNGIIKKRNIHSLIEIASNYNAIAVTAFLLEYNNKLDRSSKPVMKGDKKQEKEESISEWTIVPLPDGTYEIERYKGKEQVVTVPDSYEGKRITSIGETALSGRRLKGCNTIEEVIVPEGISTIKYEAFYGCKNLKRIVLPMTLLEIEYAAFKNCRKLEEVVFSVNLDEHLCRPSDNNNGDHSYLWKLKSIGKNAFNGCGNLARIIIPDTVKIIGEECFAGCNMLTIISNTRCYATQYAAWNAIPWEVWD